jgi:hypothetical protein
MTFDLTRASAITKERYPADEVQRMSYKNRPLFAMLEKDESFTGELMKVPQQYGNPQNRSTKFSQAKAGTSSSSYEAFKIERVKNYSFASIDNETILATENDDGAFLRALESEMDGAFEAIANDLGQTVWGDGTHTIGVISAVNTTTKVITLVNESDSVNFEVGMSLEFSDDLTGTTVHSGAAQVSAVDRENGTVTYAGVVAGIAADDYIFPAGDKNSALSGVGAWIPYGSNRATALAASYWGVTRSTDPTRLGGWYKDFSTLPIEEALSKFVALLGREGGNPDVIFLNPMDWDELKRSLGSKVQYVNKMIAQVGFQGIQIVGYNGVLECYADRWVPYGYASVMQMNTWKLCSLGPVIRTFNTDGLLMLRSQTSDGVDIQINSYAQLKCNAVGYNGWVKIR